MKKPAVTAMHHAHIKSAAFCAHCGFSEGLRDILNCFFIHFIDFHQLIGLVRPVVDNQCDLIALAEQAVLAGCDRRDKSHVVQVFRERKGHQCTVRLAFALQTKDRIGLLAGQLPDSITNSRSAWFTRTVFRVFITSNEDTP